MLVWSDVPVLHLRRSGAADCVCPQSAVSALEGLVSFDDELRCTGADRLLSECAEGQRPSFLVRPLLDDPHGNPYLENAPAREDLAASAVPLTLEVDAPLTRLEEIAQRPLGCLNVADCGGGRDDVVPAAFGSST